MSREMKLVLVMVAMVLFGAVGCGKAARANVSGHVGPTNVTPVQKLRFTDHVRYHNMGIAWDGDYYYTINGGNSGSSDINKYDESGKFEENYDLSVDGRAILYNSDEEQLYLKENGTDLSSVDLDLEEANVEHSGIFQGEQSHVAMSPDGSSLYELSDGKVHVYDASSGDVNDSFDLSSYSSDDDGGYAYAIAASDKFLFVWAPNSDKDILVFDLEGKYVTKFTLPRSGYGYSLSWANDMLWVARDADGGTDGADGTWYGYELEGLE